MSDSHDHRHDILLGTENPYQSPVEIDLPMELLTSGEDKGMVSMALGGASLLIALLNCGFGLLFVVSVPMSVVSLRWGTQSLNSSNRRKAICGIVCSTLALTAVLLWLLGFVLFLAGWLKLP